MVLHNTILEIIYTRFSKWSTSGNFCCSPGCASCCTRNVTITALEGRRILDYLQSRKSATWLADRFNTLNPLPAPAQTTNEFIAALLNDQEEASSQTNFQESCPFLDKYDNCSIYPVRPFSCRCFFSTTLCSSQQPATVDNCHLYGSMAMLQIIEHLGQFDWWGNMVEVITVLSLNPDYDSISARLEDTELFQQAPGIVRRARPLPGFILPEEGRERASLLVQSVLTARLADKTVEQILNGQ